MSEAAPSALPQWLKVILFVPFGAVVGGCLGSMMSTLMYGAIVLTGNESAEFGRWYVFASTGGFWALIYFCGAIMWSVAMHGKIRSPDAILFWTIMIAIGCGCAGNVIRPPPWR